MTRVTPRAAVLFAAVFGIAACTQSPSESLSGSAVGGATEVAPAVPATEAPPAPPAAEDGEAGAPMVPDGVVAPADPKGSGEPAAPADDASADSSADAESGAGLDSLDPGDNDAYVAAHNRWRQNYGTANVEWDQTIADFAQEWADVQAAADTFNHRDNNPYGENLFSGTSGFYGPDAVVDSWGSEVKDWDLTCTGDLEQCCKVDWSKCGHFTQVVWATTTKIGCGKATTASGNDIMVCNYSPAGNMSGVSPFPPLPTPTPAAVTPRPAGAAAIMKAPKLAIPDAGAAVSYAVNFTGYANKKVNRVSVSVKITHSYVGDLSIKLVHPDGTEVMLRNRTGGNTQNIAEAYGYTGIPVAGLDKLAGKPVDGSWKVVIQDHEAQDAGTFDMTTVQVEYYNG